MPRTVILIAETTSAFIAALQKNYRLYTARSGKRGMLLAGTHQADVIILDAVSLRTSGERICKRLRKTFPDRYLIHIHDRPKTEINSLADMVLTMPLSSRMLLNTIEHLIAQTSDHLLHCGPFTLDVKRSLLQVAGDEVPLTPKQAALIEVFMRHPNETLERGWLMEQVWDTTYAGDTRTLSVHIRYVREVLEDDASKPRYIQTVRGAGYRFVLDEHKKTDQ